MSEKSPLFCVFASCGECAHAVEIARARSASREKTHESRKIEQKNELDVRFHVRKANIQLQNCKYEIANCRTSFRAHLSMLAFAVHEIECVN